MYLLESIHMHIFIYILSTCFSSFFVRPLSLWLALSLPLSLSRILSLSLSPSVRSPVEGTSPSRQPERGGEYEAKTEGCERGSDFASFSFRRTSRYNADGLGLSMVAFAFPRRSAGSSQPAGCHFRRKFFANLGGTRNSSFIVHLFASVGHFS